MIMSSHPEITKTYLKQLVKTRENIACLIRNPNVTVDHIKYMMCHKVDLTSHDNSGENLLHIACQVKPLNFDIIK